MAKQLKWKEYSGNEWYGPEAWILRGSMVLEVQANLGNKSGTILLVHNDSGRIWVEIPYDGDLQRGKDLAFRLSNWWMEHKPLKPLKKGRKNARG